MTAQVSQRGRCVNIWSQRKKQPPNTYSPCAGSGWFCSQQPGESPETGPHPVSGCYGNVVENRKKNASQNLKNVRIKSQLTLSCVVDDITRILLTWMVQIFPLTPRWNLCSYHELTLSKSIQRQKSARISSSSSSAQGFSSCCSPGTLSLSLWELLFAVLCMY